MSTAKNKVQLEYPPSDDDPRWNGENKLPNITHSLPYFKSNQGSAKYYHRVRSMTNHGHYNKYSHTSVDFWCSGSGFISNGDGSLYAKVPSDGVLCAVCEGKAIGAGCDGSRTINGKDVMYSPRKPYITRSLTPPPQ